MDEKSEHVPQTAFGGRATHPIRRWHEITNLKANPDGTKDLFIKRFWWGAKEACSPTLYDPENYTYDGHERPLAYAIAPGAYVFDVAEAVDGTPRGKPPYTLYVTPFTDTGTPFDFEPGDSIEQAIGPDPFKPQGMRFIVGDAVPGAWPSGSLTATMSARLHATTASRFADMQARWRNVPSAPTVVRADGATALSLHGSRS